MITNAHITVTSWAFPFGGMLTVGRETALAMRFSWLCLAPTEGAENFGALPLQGSVALGCGTFLWFDDMVNFSLALSVPSVNLIVLVWKSLSVATSFFVMLLTKCIEWLGAGTARGGGVGASDRSISFLVEMIG